MGLVFKTINLAQACSSGWTIRKSSAHLCLTPGYLMYQYTFSIFGKRKFYKLNVPNVFPLLIMIIFRNPAEGLEDVII